MNINEHDDLGLTRLHKACQEGDVQEVVDLLRNGADVNVKSIRGTRQRGIKHIINSTPLHIATFQGDMEIVRLLLENGARIDAIDDVRNTSLHLAVWRKRLELCELLLWRGANANIANTSDSTPAHIAASCGYDEGLEVLFALGFNRFDDILVHATHYQQFSTVELMFELNGHAELDACLPQNDDVAPKMQRLFAEQSKKSIQQREQTRSETLQRIKSTVGVRLLRFAHPEIVGICIAMSPLELPPYVLLWIIDWLPNYDLLSHHKKIHLIESIRNSISKLKSKQ